MYVYLTFCVLKGNKNDSASFQKFILNDELRKKEFHNKNQFVADISYDKLKKFKHFFYFALASERSFVV